MNRIATILAIFAIPAIGAIYCLATAPAVAVSPSVKLVSATGGPTSTIMDLSNLQPVTSSFAESGLKDGEWKQSAELIANQKEILSQESLIAFLNPEEIESVQESLEEVPRHQRWKIFMNEGETVAEYAKKLDYFGIQIGALVNSTQIEYISQLSAQTPRKTVGPVSDEKRLYMTWKTDSRSDTDKEFLAKAGVEASGNILLIFISESIENLMAETETKYKGLKEAEILSTHFGIREAAGAFEFYVISQEALAK